MVIWFGCSAGKVDRMLVDATTSIIYLMVELTNKEVFPVAVKGELYKIIVPDDLQGVGGSNYVKSSRQLYKYLKSTGRSKLKASCTIIYNIASQDEA